jgi:hypothetical protein
MRVPSRVVANMMCVHLLLVPPAPVASLPALP